MQIVEPISSCTVFDATGQVAYRLEEGLRYLLYDQEAGKGLQQNALRLVTGRTLIPPIYDGRTLTAERLLLPFIGKHGDAISVAQCVQSLVDTYPSISVDVYAPDNVAEVFALFEWAIGVLKYPAVEHDLPHYDYLLSLEDVDAVRRGSSRSCADVFRTCLRTPRAQRFPIVRPAPIGYDDHDQLTDRSRPRVAIQVGRDNCLRSYPVDLVEKLVSLLVDCGIGVHLIGASDAPTIHCDTKTSCVRNLVGHTKSVRDLANVLEHMDAAVTCDSFPMHLCGVLGIPTVAIFTSTNTVLASDYPSVQAAESDESCSPCGRADGCCPEGHSMCIAHRSPNVRPESIVALLSEILSTTTPRCAARRERIRSASCSP